MHGECVRKSGAGAPRASSAVVSSWGWSDGQHVPPQHSEVVPGSDDLDWGSRQPPQLAAAGAGRLMATRPVSVKAHWEEDRGGQRDGVVA